MKRLLFSMLGVFVLSHATYGIDLYIPMDYGTLPSETLLFDPLDGTGTATLAGGANWITGIYGQGVQITQNKGENVNWDANSVSASRLDEGAIEFYWKVPSGGVSWFSTDWNMIFEDDATEIQIYMPNNDPNLTFGLFQRPPNSYTTLTTTNVSWTPDTWYHLAFTWSGSGMQIWINGVLANFSSSAAHWNSQNATTLYIGSQSTARVPLVGTFDSLRISNTAYRYTPIPPVPQTCGDPGTEYLDADLDQNCIVDLADFGNFVSEWLHCSDPNNILCDPFWP